MSQAMKTKLSGGGMSYWTKYTREELKTQGWNNFHGQGNHQARMRGSSCVIVPITNEETALILTALFVRKFAIPSCTHWDGQTLSLYCGGSGSNHLQHSIQTIVDTYKSLNNPDYSNSLFADKIPHKCTISCEGYTHSCDKCGLLVNVFFVSGLPVLCSLCIKNQNEERETITV